MFRMKYVVIRVSFIFIMEVMKNLLIKGVMFEVVGVFLVIISIKIVIVSNVVIMSVIFFLVLGGKMKVRRVKVVMRK